MSIDNGGQTARLKIDSLQALKTLAFLGIFLSHAKLSYMWYNLGVSVFFVLSGFLMTHVYDRRELTPSLKNNANFTIRKIKKLYPLHIITMLCFVVLNLIFAALYGGITLKSISYLLCKIGLNVTLLQSWIPNRFINTSLNSVAWYFSVMLFLYFIFPWLHAFIKKTRKNILYMIGMMLLIIQIVACFVFLRFIGRIDNVYVWFMYHSPVFRTGDFFIGCVLSRWYFEGDFSRINTLKATVYEIIAAIITISVLIWSNKSHSTTVSSAICNQTTIYIPLAACWVFLFTLNKGLVSRSLTNKLVIYMGDICAYLFFINFVVTEYTNFAIKVFKWNVRIDNLMLVGIELGITVLLSIGYKFLISVIMTTHNQEQAKTS
ncbi:MAG: acyltransferase [Lentisphaeria bacterium]|nr:acyltransferase [Lentisphaeria bacterium]